MAGRRILCQSLHAEYASQGIHIAHILIDGAVDSPDTLGKVLGQQKFEKLRTNRLLIAPKAVAETYWHLHSQHRSAWTQELDLRPASEPMAKL